MRLSRVRYAWLWPVLTAAVVCAVALVPASPATARGSYTAMADARTVAVDFTVRPGVLFDQLVDAGYDVAQAELDSLGQSSAFASSPYPSESAILLPGLVAGLTAGETSGLIPEYPLIASSSHPTVPEDRVDAAAITLATASSVTDSQGSATSAVGGSVVDVAVDSTTGVVRARAESTLSELRLSDALVLLGVRSEAIVQRSEDGVLDRSSTFEVAALSVLGQRIAIAGGDLEGLTNPLLQPLLAELAQGGTSLEVVPATETENGVVSAGLRITNTSGVPPELASGIEEVETVVTIGVVAASVEGRAFPAVTGALQNVDTDTTPTADSSTVTPSRSTAQPTPVVRSGAGPAASATPTVASTSSNGDVLSLVADVSVAAFYPVLLLAGTLAVVAVTSFRKLAVRSP